MKFNEYVALINKINQENPEYSDLEVIYAVDEEGNEYKGVYYEPRIALVDELTTCYSYDYVICGDTVEDIAENIGCKIDEVDINDYRRVILIN